MKMFLQIDINMFSCSIFQTDIVFQTKVFPHLFYTSHHKGARNVCKSNRNMAVDDTEFPCHEKLSCVLIFIYF